MKLLASRASAALAGLALAAGAVAAPAPEPAPEPAGSPLRQLLPAVVVDLAGGDRVKGRSLLGVDTFNAIPYADPPVGALRLRPPRRFSGRLGTHDGTDPAPACPQMMVSTGAQDVVRKAASLLLDSPVLRPLEGQEDCLTLNMQRPAGTKAGDKLPVLFWIWGGAFEFGGSANYDGTSLLTTAVAQDQPFVLVSINHRVAGFGFMPGKEVLADGAVNLGLLDQRMALEWVADNIAAFGGDPDKVTIWGLSSGAISVFDKMLLYGGNASYQGKPLFRGAILNSGAAALAEPVDGPKGQAVYDAMVREVGCSGAGDTLACLRELPYYRFLRAANSVPSFFSYSSVALSYLPRPDGRVLPDSPERLIAAGRFYDVPMIIGNTEDEGTTLALFQQNVTSAADMAQYLNDVFFPSTPRRLLRQYVDLYEPALLQGSPFRTGFFWELYLGFKRVSAILGDLVFSLARRAFLKDATRVKPKMRAWAYLSSYNHGLPFLGTFHAAGVSQIFFGVPPNYAAQSTRTYYFNFIYNLDPNKGVGGYAHWPEWKEKQELLWFETPFSNNILKDDFRSGAMAWLDENLFNLHM